MTLYGEFLGGDHRRMHKWHQYFPAYEAHFQRFQNRHITLFEIGIGEGGSLQQWRRYFGPFATIVGLDIYPRCKQVEEDQVHVRIGRQTDVDFLASVVAEFGAPDIVVDDGSHIQPHINTTFEFLYPKVAKNGVYLVEDLHSAYWPNHGGGLRAAGSFIETAKTYVDRMHASYLGGAPDPEGARTKSIHFYDSIVVFEVGEARVMTNSTTGDAARFDTRWAPPGHTTESFDLVVEAALKDMDLPGESFEPEAVAHPVPLPEAVADDPRDALLRLREEEIRLLRASTSWKLTAPWRAIGRLLK